MPDLRSDDRKQKQGNPAESRDALSVAFLPRHLNSPLGLCFPNKKHPPDTSSAYAALGGEVPQHRRVERSCTQQHSPSIRLPATHRYASVPLLTSPPASRWSKALRQDCVTLPSSFDLLLFRHLSHGVHKSWMSHSGFLSRTKWCFWGAGGWYSKCPPTSCQQQKQVSSPPPKSRWIYIFLAFKNKIKESVLPSQSLRPRGISF